MSGKNTKRNPLPLGLTLDATCALQETFWIVAKSPSSDYPTLLSQRGSLEQKTQQLRQLGATPDEITRMNGQINNGTEQIFVCSTAYSSAQLENLNLGFRLL